MTSKAAILVRFRTFRAVLLGVFCAIAGGPLHGREADKQDDFAHAVVPILRKHCVECHGGHRHEGDFSVNTRQLLLDSGAVVPGGAAASYLIDLVTSDDPETRMPKDKPRLSSAEVKVLREWIDADVHWEAGFSFAPSDYEPPLRPRRPELPPATEGRTNPIDRFLDAYLIAHEQPRPVPLQDAAFARRAYLDTIGLLPTPEQLHTFLADADPDKRANLIDELLANDRAYAEHWLTFWNDLLRNDYVGSGYTDGGRQQITAWLYRALTANMPFDQFVRGLIAPAAEAEGFIRGINWRGDVNASQRPEIQFSQNVSQVFLGINMKCASCHDSFIDRWTLAETYSVAAVYADEPLELYRCDKPTGAMAEAAWMFPELGQVDPQAPRDERLKQLAALMTDPQNGRLTRTIVNRLWHRLMGRGIVHPVDAMQTEPWSADLLDYLAIHLAENDYDLKSTLRIILDSHAYQSQAVVLEEEPEPATFVYTGPIAKRMSAEQFVDAVWQITETGPSEPYKTVGEFLSESERASHQTYRAALVTSNLLMRSLGRPNRDQVVTDRPASLTMLQALDLSNSVILTDVLHRGASHLIDHFRGQDSEEIIEWLFQAALSRLPSEDERAAGMQLLGSTPTPESIEDLVWIVIMLPEFQIIR